MDAPISSSRKAVLGSTRTPRLGANSEGRDAYDMVDEIFELKKELLAHRTERTLLKAKIRQLEHECEKGRQTPGGQAGSNTAPGNSLVHSLKQQVRELRNTVEAKEAALTAAKDKVAYTSLEELELQLGIYAEEIARLQMVLDQQVCTASFVEQRIKEKFCWPMGGRRGSSIIGWALWGPKRRHQLNRLPNDNPGRGRCLGRAQVRCAPR